jgi:hypothetical protein
MTTAQATTDSTPIQKIAARGESRSVRLPSDAAVIDLQISACGSLGIFYDFLAVTPQRGRS